MSPFIPCPPTLKFEQFLLGRLEDKEYESLEVHLASCTHCQQLLTTTVADDELVQTLRKISNSSSAEKSTRLADAPDELVDLLVPHFKRIANSLDETALFASRPARRAGSKLQETSTSDTAESQRIGRYEIQGVLGQGGMGVVLQAFDPLLRRTVAIKVIQSKLLADKGMASRLVREAQAAAAVEHDNIVPVYSVEIHEDAPCIIMPLLRGITLKQRLDETTGPLPLAEILRIAREAASGLAAAHAGGLIHCDIKPANLWLEEPLGRVKVLDFGLAFVSGDLESGSEGIAGTPGYLAPEQARGLPLDQRTDIFSLGCVLYRMATGVAPFSGAPRLRVLWTVLSDPPQPAGQLNSQLPRELSDLISRMLSRESIARPASSAEVVAELKALEQRLADQKNKVMRRRWLGAMAAAALLSGLAVGAWGMLTATPVDAPVKVTLIGDEPPLAIVLRHEGQDQSVTLGREKTLDLLPGDYSVRPAAVVPGRELVPNHFSIVAEKPQTLRIAFTGEVASHATHTQLVTCVAVLPGPSGTVYSAGLDRTLAAWDPSATSAARFVNLPNAARCLAVSPNGKIVAVAGGNKQPPAELEIKLWNASDLTPHGEPLAGHTRFVQALAYSPDGTKLASAGADGVFLWDVNTGESQTLVSAESQMIRALAYSADGQQLLTGGDEGQIVVWDTRTQMQVQTHTASKSAVRAVAFLADRLVAAGDDGTIRIWKEGALQQEWLGQGQAVLALAVSPDGQTLLSGDAGGSIRVWSVSRGRTIQTLRANDRAVQALAFYNNGRQAVSGGADGVVRLWQLPFSD